MNKYENKPTISFLMFSKRYTELNAVEKREYNRVRTAEWRKSNYKAKNITEQTMAFLMFGKRYTELNAAEKREYDRVRMAEWRKSNYKAEKMEA